MSVQLSNLYFHENVVGSAFIPSGTREIIPSHLYISPPPLSQVDNALQGTNSF